LSKPDARAAVEVPWRTVALVSGLIAVAAITTAIVVVALRDADALSAVALALAVIAFIVQIILFLFQQTAASNNEARLNDLQSDLTASLQELTSRSATTHESVSEVRRALWDYVFASQQQAGEAPSRPAETESPGHSATNGGVKPSSRPPAKQGDTSMLEVPPPDRARAALDAFKTLGIGTTYSIHNLARARLREGEDSTMRTINPISAPELTKHGLLRRIRDRSGKAVFKLTPRGADVGRLFLADVTDDSPYASEILEVQNELRAYEKKLQSFMTDRIDQIPVEEDDS